ncbi:hypothetical protein TNCV_1814141 [Trichonephila clavipes]|nr:hypothetical protein TNCV_1814141 [Trichonephila clavipes]
MQADFSGSFRRVFWGCGRRGVKVSDRGWPCHEFKPSTTKDPPCRERCSLNLSRAQTSSLGVVWLLGEEVPAQASLTSLSTVQNYEVRRQKPSCSSCATLIFTHSLTHQAYK